MKTSTHSKLDVFEKLKKDHRVVESLFKKLLATDNDDAEEREDLFDQIYAELEAHAKAEEKVFYPVTEENMTTHNLTLEAYEEHGLIKQVLEQLSEMEKTSDAWTAKAKVLSELVKHHVNEEETQLFPKSKKFISKEESSEEAVEIQEEEDRVKEELQSSAA